MKKTILFISFSLIVLFFCVAVESATAIDSQSLEGTFWKGSYDLSSGHSGEIQIDFGEKEFFYFVLPDEEVGYEYAGKIKEVIWEKGQWIIRAFILKEIKAGVNIETGEDIEETQLVTLPFEVILQGGWLKATPGPQELIEGVMSFKGTSPEVKWFLDKTGKFKVYKLNCSLGKEQEAKGKTLIIREGKQVRDNIVAIEAYYLGGGILEVVVEARMRSQRPRIRNILVVGPRLGRLRHAAKEEIPVTVEEDQAYPVTKKGGLFSFGNKTKVKKLKGSLTKELFQFKIPRDKIISGKRYQLWVDLESKNKGGDRPTKFKFNLEKLAEILN